MRVLINNLLELITVLALIIMVLFLISVIVFFIQQLILKYKIRKATKQLKKMVKDQNLVGSFIESLNTENIERTDDK